MGMRDKSTQEVEVLDPVTLAGALGARWLIQYDASCSAVMVDLPTSVMASGVTIAPSFTEDAWHRNAALWWPVALSGDYAVKSSFGVDTAASSSDSAVDADQSAYPADQSAYPADQSAYPADQSAYPADHLASDRVMNMSDILLSGLPMPQFDGVPILVGDALKAVYPADQAASGVSLQHSPRQTRSAG